MRKSLAQIAREDRNRTEKWRAARAARRVPEARQVDKAMLMAFLQRGRKGAVYMIDEAALPDIYHLALRFLVSWRCDRSEAMKALKKRVAALSSDRQMETLKSREAWDEVDQMRAAETVTP